MVNDKLSASQTVQVLQDKGLEESTAKLVVDVIEKQINGSKREQANSDVIWGAVWFIGGLIATMADFGFIFWGAMLFGAIQFIKGLLKV